MKPPSCNPLFDERVLAFVQAAGGLRAFESTGAGDPVVLIETKAGLLTVHPLGTWIHTKFQDVKRANALFGNEQGHLNAVGCPNPFTGKWNFHGDTAFEDFTRRFPFVQVQAEPLSA